MVKWIEWRFVYKLWWAFITYWDQGWAGKVPGVQETLIRSRSNFSGTSDFQNKQNSHFLVIWQWNEFSTMVCLKIMNALWVQEYHTCNTWIIPAQILYTDSLIYFLYNCKISIRFDLLSWFYDFFMKVSFNYGNCPKMLRIFLQKFLFLSITNLSAKLIAWHDNIIIRLPKDHNDL